MTNEPRRAIGELQKIKSILEKGLRTTGIPEQEEEVVERALRHIEATIKHLRAGNVDDRGDLSTTQAILSTHRNFLNAEPAKKKVKALESMLQQVMESLGWS